MKGLGMNFIVALVFLLALVSVAASQEQVDVIYLKDGSKIYGTIIQEVPGKNVIIRTIDGRIIVLTSDRIEKITKESFKEIPQDFEKISYPEIGVTLGFPAILNGDFGYWIQSFGFRVSGMYYGTSLNGFQLNFGGKLSGNPKGNHSLGGVFGRSHLDASGLEGTSDTRIYFGPAYDLNLSVFFLEIGFAIADVSTKEGIHTYHSTSLLPILQIGLMHRFLPD